MKNNNVIVLGIESSCDETACSIIKYPNIILSSVVSSQANLHKKYGGVVPELASRNHLKDIKPIILSALNKANCTLSQINVIASTTGPGLASSLLVGSTVGKALAMSLNVPFIGVNHLEGHLLSTFIGSRTNEYSGLALIVSGGHTLLIDVKGFNNYKLLGTTRDDAAGEAFDKAAKMMGLPYPGGVEIEKLAINGNKKAFKFPRSMLNNNHAHNFEFSFSGLKTSLLYKIKDLGLATINKKDESCTPRIVLGEHTKILSDLCASYQEAIIEVLIIKTLRAAKYFNRKRILISGGVINNNKLRNDFEEACKKNSLDLLLTSKNLTTDNAVMIAYCGVLHFAEDNYSDIQVDVKPNTIF